jgi:hypothetical protein
MIDLGRSRLILALFVELLGQPTDGQADLVESLPAFGRINERALDDRAFIGLELAQHEGG